MKRANKLYYRITCDANGEVMTVESSDKPSEEFVKLKDEHLEALHHRRKESSRRCRRTITLTT